MKVSSSDVKAVAFSDDDGQLWVEVEGSTVDSVRSTEAKLCAIKAASEQGYGRCGFNQDTGPFIVDENGKEVTSVNDSEKLKKESELLTSGKARYRNRLRLMQGTGV